MKKIILLLFCVPMMLAAQQLAEIDVTVTDFNGKAISGDQINFIGQRSKRTIFGISNTTGKFRIALPPNDIYSIQIKSIGEEKEYNTLEIPKLEEGQSFQVMQLEISYEEEKNVALNNLHFESGKAELKPSSYSELNDLIEIMKRKPLMKILIAGHTDNEGAPSDNLTLSQKRADAVKSHLVSKGILASRIQTKGYGDTRPVASNETTLGKAKNRRTEIRIL